MSLVGVNVSVSTSPSDEGRYHASSPPPEAMQQQQQGLSKDDPHAPPSPFTGAESLFLQGLQTSNISAAALAQQIRANQNTPGGGDWSTIFGSVRSTNDVDDFVSACDRASADDITLDPTIDALLLDDHDITNANEITADDVDDDHNNTNNDTTCIVDNTSTVNVVSPIASSSTTNNVFVEDDLQSNNVSKLLEQDALAKQQQNIFLDKTEADYLEERERQLRFFQQRQKAKDTAEKQPTTTTKPRAIVENENQPNDTDRIITQAATTATTNKQINKKHTFTMSEDGKVHVDAVSHVYETAKNVWGWGKEKVFFAKPFMGLAEGVANKVVGFGGTNLAEIDKNIKPQLQKVDDTVLNPAIQAVVGILMGASSKTESMIKPMIMTLLKPLDYLLKNRAENTNATDDSTKPTTTTKKTMTKDGHEKQKENEGVAPEIAVMPVN